MAAKLYTPFNYLSTATHLGASAALVGASLLLFAAPWAVVVGGALAGGFMAAMVKLQQHYFENRLQEHPKNHTYSPNLGRIAEDLYRASGLSRDKFPIYDFGAAPRVDKDGKPMRKSIFGKAMEMMQTVPNAAAINLRKPVIMISTPLMKLLDDEEEKAVLAHEFAHAAAHHTHIGLPQRFAGTVARGANTFTVIGEALMSGFTAVVASLAARVGVAYAAYSMHPDGHLMKKEREKMSVPEAYKESRAIKLTNAFSSVAGTAVLTAFNPAYLGIWAGAKGIAISAGLIEKSMSRSMEFQADRGAVQYGADPLALITSLRKITALMERSKKSAWGNEPLPKPGMLAKTWNELNATHPPLKARIGELEAMARAKGISEDRIQLAVKGPVDISGGDNIPETTLRMMASRLV